MHTEELVGLVATFGAPNVFNPWREFDPLDRCPIAPDFAPRERRKRLAQHFDCKPRFLLVGEAPGYQGCHFSGVPFTNEKLLMAGMVPRVTMPPGVQMRITTRDKPWSEPSATIVWRTLHELGIAEHVVMWNAFAWHPHKPGEPMSNRAPAPAELVAGLDVLRAVTAHFRAAHVIAVGRVAEATLRRLSVSCNSAVRHPSMGGANEFRDGMAKLATA